MRHPEAARTISRMAVGSRPPGVDSSIYWVAQDMQQQHRVEELPFGTRGGLLVKHFFPQDAEYDIRVAVGKTRGLSETHTMAVAIDSRQVQLFAVGKPADSEPQHPLRQTQRSCPTRPTASTRSTSP